MEMKAVKCFNAARSIVCVETVLEFTIADEILGFNAARSIVCVETLKDQSKISSRYLVSMPHAALCVSRLCNSKLHFEHHWRFQCRTQHCVCRDAVSRSPCPARAEKAFWKDALFCAVFGVCG